MAIHVHFRSRSRSLVALTASPSEARLGLDLTASPSEARLGLDLTASPHRVPGAAVLAFCALFLGGCGSSRAGGPGSPSASSLPAYRGDAADQFDDTIEAHAVGLELENYTAPKNDPRLRVRAQAADAVVRARVQTVTSEGGSGSRTYQLSFKTLAHLAGGRPIGDEFTVRVDKTSPSLGIVRNMEGQLVGKTLVVFAKAFARADGERDIHFHAAADAADVAEAVKEAVILDEVK